jgi:hypothetical protein
VPSESQLADILSKPLDFDSFAPLREAIGVVIDIDINAT